MKYLLTCFIIIAIQSCISVSLGNRSRWQNIKEQDSRTAQQKKMPIDRRPNVCVSLINNQRNLVLPFFFIDIDRKNYYVQFDIETYNNDFAVLDSINYEIKSQEGTVLYRGTGHPKDKRIDIIEESKYAYQASVSTDSDLEFDKKIREDLLIQFILHLRDNEGKPILEKYLLPLKGEKPKWFRIGSILG
ncbi:hypothetical protein AHMF7605_27020 [Adhaeribacter arboris]|uniref:Lipoprotein n=1 Tax=Adhaeribacter arboris TaxID=2072846 RepID=A0A2T2YN32_9BACT|nr:hypothetical protein [Adhaeribacter arboris]PSR56889.1 hypothetical protein AHMF7605_27020 [Adhaeribacter arboris]